MKSLQSRLHIGLMSSLFILITLVWWLANTSITHIATQMLQTRLEHDGEALLAGLQLSSTGKLEFKNVQLSPVYNRVFSGHYYLITSNEQRLRSHSLWDQTLQQPPVQAGQSIVETVKGPDKQQLLQWTSRFERFQQPITISVAEDTSTLSASLNAFNIYFAAAAGLILVSLLLIQSLIIRRSLRSLSTIKEELQALSEGDIKTLSKEVPSEIRPLIDEVNHLLQLLRKQLKRSRNATGNLAHSLKHPLNLLVQLAESDEAELPTSIREELEINTRQINQLMERELKRAKLVGSGIPGQFFSPQNELPGLIDVLERVYHDKTLHIELDVPNKLEYPADKSDMLELFGNLLDNAYKWASKEVRCKVHENNDFIIRVEDDGPGCDDKQLSSLTERGVRVDETVGGTGLGLAIVKDIVELYQGEIYFYQSELGGFCIKVKLPLNNIN